VAVIYTRGMVKKNDTSLPRRRFCWLNGIGGQSWRIFVFQKWNLNFFLQGLNPKVHYITGVKNTIKRTSNVQVKITTPMYMHH